MKIADIKVGDRVRKKTGWLDDLERSIQALGVLQPIGVSPDGELIFGYRRLMACKALGLEEIPARVIDISADDPAAALRMEQAENEIRRDFTASERLEIAKRIEVALAGRRGTNQHTKEDVQNFAQAEGKKTRDLAAQSVGWSGEQLRKAKVVFDEADEETKAAVDDGTISIHKAYTEVAEKKQAKPKKPKPKNNGRVWKLSLNLDSAESLQELADKIVEEVDEPLAIAMAERILSRYGKLEVTK